MKHPELVANQFKGTFPIKISTIDAHHKQEALTHFLWIR